MKYKLGDIFEFIRNGASIKQGAEGGYPITRIETIAKGYVDKNRMGYAAISDINRYKDYLLKDGDILMSHINSENHLGKTAIFENLNDIIIHGMNLLCLRPNKKTINTKYVFHFFNSKQFKSQIPKIVKKSVNQASFSISDLRKIDISLPPLETQKKISAVLDKAQGLIAKRKEQIEALDEFINSVFLDMFGDPVKNPKGWSIKILSEIAQVSSGVTKGRKLNKDDIIKVPYMRVANVQDGFIDINNIQEIEVTHKELERYRLEIGDVLLTEGGDPDKLGRGAVWKFNISNCIHQNHIFKIRVDCSKLNPEYLSVLIGSTYGKRYFLRAAKQTTGIATINSTQLKRFPNIVPPIELQNRFAQIVQKTEQQKEILQKSLAELENNFNSLMQRAFKGELFN